ncbi:MAG: TonB-dependent receptor [Gammaproteobacteria bacterium AqS3]|nr:TonB-dependent receptor [Gammaproteobacteria bacterium AqS3]
MVRGALLGLIALTALVQGAEESVRTDASSYTSDITLTRSDLDQLTSWRLTDLVGGAAGVFFADAYTEGAIAMRGLTSRNLLAGSEPSAGVYVDGVYMSRPQQMVLPFLDVESVQILRGPQSARHGVGASSGVILVNTVKPDPDRDWEGAARAFAGNEGRRGYELAVKAPLGEASNMRIVLHDSQQPDWIQSRSYSVLTHQGRTVNTSITRRYGETEGYGKRQVRALRAQFLWDFDAVQLTYKIETARQAGPGNPEQLIHCQAGEADSEATPNLCGLTLAGDSPVYEAEYDLNGYSSSGAVVALGQGRKLDVPVLSRGFTRLEDDEIDTINSVLSVLIPRERFDIHLHWALGDFDTAFYRDLDGTPVAGAALRRTLQSSYSEVEVRISSPSEVLAALHWTMGWRMQSEKVNDLQRELRPPEPQQFSTTIWGTRFRQDTDQLHYFLSLEWNAREDLQVLSDVRLMRVQKGVRTQRNYLAGVQSLDTVNSRSFLNPVWAVESCRIECRKQSLVDTVYAYQLTVVRRLSDWQTSYAKFASGYKPAGFNAPYEPSQYRLGAGQALGHAINLSEYERELIQSFEIGGVTDLGTGRQIDFALFFTQSKNLQMPALRDGLLVLENLAEASSYGLEIDSVYALSDRLRWHIGVSLLRTELDEFSASCSAMEFAQGIGTCGDAELPASEATRIARVKMPLQFAPEYSLVVGWDWTRALSETRMFEFSLLIRAHDSYGIGDDYDSAIRQDSITRTRLDATFSDVSARWRAQLFIDNIEDETPLVQVRSGSEYNHPGALLVTAAEGRRYGVDLRYSW